MHVDQAAELVLEKHIGCSDFYRTWRGSFAHFFLVLVSLIENKEALLATIGWAAGRVVLRIYAAHFGDLFLQLEDNVHQTELLGGLMHFIGALASLHDHLVTTDYKIVVRVCVVLEDFSLEVIFSFRLHLVFFFIFFRIILDNIAAKKVIYPSICK